MPKNFGLSDEMFKKLIDELNNGGNDYRSYYEERVVVRTNDGRVKWPRNSAAVDLLDSTSYLALFASIRKHRTSALHAIVEYYSELSHGLVKKIQDELDLISNKYWPDYLAKAKGYQLDAAKRMFRSTSMAMSKIWDDVPKINETAACRVVIDYYVPKAAKPKQAELTEAQMIMLRHELTNTLGLADWKEQVYRWKEKSKAAQRILSDYTATDEFWKHLPLSLTEAAKTYVINHYTKEADEESWELSAGNTLLTGTQQNELDKILKQWVPLDKWQETVEKHHGFKVDAALNMLYRNKFFKDFYLKMKPTQEDAAVYRIVNYLNVVENAFCKEENKPVKKPISLNKPKQAQLVKMFERHNVDGEDWADLNSEYASDNEDEAAKQLLDNEHSDIHDFYADLSAQEKKAAVNFTMDYFEKKMTPDDIERLEEYLSDFIETVDRYFIDQGPGEETIKAMLSNEADFESIYHDFVEGGKLDEAAKRIVEYHDDNTSELGSGDEGEATTIIENYYTNPKEVSMGSKLDKVQKEDLTEILEEEIDKARWPSNLKGFEGDAERTARYMLRNYKALDDFYRGLESETQMLEAVEIIIYHYTKDKGGKSTKNKSKQVLSEVLREKLNTALGKCNRKVWEGQVRHYDTFDDPEKDAADHMLRACDEFDDFWDAIGNQAQMDEAIKTIIYYFNETAKEEKPVTKAKRMSKVREKKLRAILSNKYSDFEQVWIGEMKNHHDERRAARNILTKYSYTDKFWEKLPASQNELAEAFVINHFTKGEGIMGKVKKAVDTAKGAAGKTKDDTINAMGIVTKMEAGDIAINNIKKVLFAGLDLPKEKKKILMEAPMVDIAVAQVAGFMMSLPEAENKMTTALHILREGMILSSTQKLVKYFDVGQYIDRMVDGIDLGALEKIGPAKKED